MKISILVAWLLVLGISGAVVELRHVFDAPAAAQHDGEAVAGQWDQEGEAFLLRPDDNRVVGRMGQGSR